MKLAYLTTLLLVYFFVIELSGQEIYYKFDFVSNKTGFIPVTGNTKYGKDSFYGYDLSTKQDRGKPFFFSVDVPEGNYAVKVVLGSNEKVTNTTIKSESRRLMLDNIKTEKGQLSTHAFIVNIRNYFIGINDSVRITSREVGKLIWDNKLTLEFNGDNPSVAQLEIKKIDNIPTIFLAGNSTVVDQRNEPWCGWGQMFTRFLTPEIAVANYAESGLAANTFVSSKRFEKLYSFIKEGDYLFIEFGHNDQKQTGEGKGPYSSYKNDLKFLIDKAREKGAIPVLITPMHRRRFDKNGKIINTHGEYPNAVKQLALEEKVYLIDLTEMSAILYEAWGEVDSKKAFVYYPKGTFQNQTKALADNTHFNSYGGYEIARCIIKGILDNKIPISDYIINEYRSFDPAFPDNEKKINIPATPFYSLEKPAGN